MLLGLFLTFVFVLLNGFFVAAEFALVKLRATQIERLAKENSNRARATVEVCKRLDRYLSATQLGITLASLGLGSVAEPSVATALDAMLHQLHIPPLWLHRISHALSFTVLTGAHILLGELVPKLIAIAAAEKVALNVARPLRVFYYFALPGLVVLNGLSSVMMKAMGFPSLHDAEGALTEEEILGMISQAYSRGGLSDAKRVMLERVMRFSDLTVRQVMVPRLDVFALDADLSLDEVIRRAYASGFTRYPLAENGNLDKVLGYVNVKDLTAEPKPAAVRAAAREFVVVPEGTGLFEVMREMQRRQTPMALVVDEYGGTSGIATLEDILEEIVGEIRDEHDEEAPRVETRNDGSVSADGLATESDLRGAGVSLEGLDGDTLGGAVQNKLGRLARQGDVVELGPYEARVESVRRRRVARVVLLRKEPLAAPPSEEH